MPLIPRSWPTMHQERTVQASIFDTGCWSDQGGLHQGTCSGPFRVSNPGVTSPPGWGLTPRSHSSGGKERLGGVSKMGNPELPPCLVVGPASRAERVRVHRHGFTPGIALVRDRWRFRWDDDLRRRSGWSRRSNGVVAVSNSQGNILRYSAETQLRICPAISRLLQCGPAGA